MEFTIKITIDNYTNQDEEALTQELEAGLVAAVDSIETNYEVEVSYDKVRNNIDG